MKHLPRFNALGKLKALTHATARVRAEPGQAPSCTRWIDLAPAIPWSNPPTAP